MPTTTNIKKYYPETMETPKKHTNQIQNNVCSTKLKAKEVTSINYQAL